MGTYLTCEENFNGYFGSDDEQNKLTDQHKRYGVKTGESDYQWHKHDARFDVAKIQMNQTALVGLWKLIRIIRTLRH